MRLLRFLGCAALVPAVGIAAAQKLKTYVDGYGDAGWSKLTGLWTTQIVRAGVRKGPYDAFAYGKNEAYDTEGTDLAFHYITRGVSAGVGARYWLGGDVYGMVTIGEGLSGANQNRSDFRAGFAGYQEWKNEDLFTDFYGEIFYIDLAKDTFLDLRYRPGRVLNSDNGNRLWVYSLAQLYAAGMAISGSDNRIEAGIGGGYVFAKGHITINAELREGYSFRGPITKKTYFNPTVYIAGNL